MASEDRQDALTAVKVAELLSHGGIVVTPADVESDMAAGAPVLPDGRIPLLAYIRWLYMQVTGAA